MVEHPHVIPWPENLPYDRQAITVPGTKRPGQTAHYRNAIFGLIDLNTPNAFKTMPEIFDAGLQVSRDRPFLGHRPILSKGPLKFANHFTWETYGQVDVRRRHIGSALHSFFKSGELGGGEFNTIGIWAPNRPEWQILDIVAQTYGMVSVSLYDTLGVGSVEYITNHAHLSVLFVSQEHISTLLRLSPQVSVLKMIVSIDNLDPEQKRIYSEWGKAQGLRILELRELEALGKQHPVQVIPASPEDVVSICYTSGTTGNPKGALLRHKNLAMAITSNMHGLSIADDAVLLSYLPLAHIYERICELCVVAIGGKVGYFTGDPLRLLEDAQILKPNFFPSVPRVLNRVYQSAMVAGATPGLKGNLFRRALQTKLDRLHTTGGVTHALWDRLVFRKIQAVLGGNLRLVSSGSAPISPDVMDFLKISFACEVTEGYGMTENCAACTKALPNDPTSSGTVGPPQPVNEIKLVDVPEMGYTAEDKPNPRGEVCVRGLNCFSEYYKDEKNTKATIDPEGWLHTGDVGEFDSVGRLKIIDRVKNIMKLAQGEYVALEKVENVYGGSPIVAQIYVHGDSLQAYLVAVMIPDPVQFASLATNVLGKPVVAEDIPALSAACEDARINAKVLSILVKEAKRSGLKGFETVKRLHLSMVPFSVETSTMTPTMKIRRMDAYNFYKTEIDALYALGEPVGSKL
ncbi:acetyl-CoA synthetase-like protein [Pluteus cervinus]|uniref:Acetyl-CoA synthetase-like protein n=1 Tax=Pluteus cervinus TaxID=181527 RepID=A0ACD3BFA3_9AGAR|nr:acetyl-CoA synthetase-like protein [Pluteus cervinus]